MQWLGRAALQIEGSFVLPWLALACLCCRRGVCPQKVNLLGGLVRDWLESRLLLGSLLGHVNLLLWLPLFVQRVLHRQIVGFVIIFNFVWRDLWLEREQFIITAFLHGSFRFLSLFVNIGRVHKLLVLFEELALVSGNKLLCIAS